LVNFHALHPNGKEFSIRYLVCSQGKLMLLSEVIMRVFNHVYTNKLSEKLIIISLMEKSFRFFKNLCNYYILNTLSFSGFI